MRHWSQYQVFFPIFGHIFYYYFYQSRCYSLWQLVRYTYTSWCIALCIFLCTHQNKLWWFYSYPRVINRLVISERSTATITIIVFITKKNISFDTNCIFFEAIILYGAIRLQYSAESFRPNGNSLNTFQALDWGK